ncbi:MAG: phosphoribosylformylglycinamidine synthase subunit PurS [Alphaproteobacteria bacterium]|nr:phosphoribosylformylglycinamidine synthase subunit PurS [Alphaproteobacteria bacterium]
MKARVDVVLKNGVLDPQGKAINQALHHLGFNQVQEVRQGKLIEIELNETNKETAMTSLKEMAEKLLTNQVIENYRITFQD